MIRFTSAFLVAAVVGLGLFVARDYLPDVTPTVPVAVDDVSQRVVELPEDGGAYHTTLLVHDDWRSRPQDRELVAWFDVEPRLASLKAQTHWHVYPESNPTHRERFAGHAVLPAVFIQKADGTVVLSEHAHELRDANAKSLGDQVGFLFRRTPARIFPRPCPRPEPEPTPVVPDDRPIIDVDVNPVIDTTPAAESAALFWVLLVAAVVVAFLVTLAVEFKRDMNAAA